MSLRSINSYLNKHCPFYIKIKEFIRKNKYLLYRPYVSLRYHQIKKKEQIKVLFVVSEASTWKTKSLYDEMMVHPRFFVQLGISTTIENPESKSVLVGYLEKNNYQYIDLDSNPNYIDSQKFDFVFYYKPYDASFSKGVSYSFHKHVIPCGVNYCYVIQNDYCAFYRPIYDYCWKYFAQNEIEAKVRKQILGIRANNTIVTGFPMQDELNRPKEEFTNPWKDRDGRKKIIYAPHHSIKGTNGGGIEFATFLIYGKFMQQLAEKYKDKIYIAFKPHPNLYKKLLKIWGQEETDAYYAAWENGENSQIEKGDYVSLFKHSDAMIHDSASFIIEYHFTGNPVMFLYADTLNLDVFNEFAKEAFDKQYIAKTKEDIENFILNVINGVDPMKEQRREFYEKNLLPPHGNTASTNIIKAILGEPPYDNC